MGVASEMQHLGQKIPGGVRHRAVARLYAIHLLGVIGACLP